MTTVEKLSRNKEGQNNTVFISLLSSLVLNLAKIIALGGSDGKESACNAGELGLIPGLGRYTGGGNGNLLQYSYPENSMNRGAWWAT